ncbi:MAG TPA: UDP-N-acetylglucosamine 1-carboxyvinyltransferase [Candidatus Monoglobus merdigallinarum]|uniref:UDP-N-acetylglucosamine 1-carboxyvinyltransferase n=1 Tax=Candidatus Monoglobus merdigallinarum TaxID=2838698 RepID=A0A9D1PQJ2_9FIRM|nr:UDP-N-acetylglucosamine 1-carboxyvinyltransferase [Candidatus Monoglobus merdigallinarum]
MSKYIINGPCRSFGGKVNISGSKNAALPVMAAALLSEDESVLYNVPRLSDTAAMAKIIESLGCGIYRDGKGAVHISASVRRPKKSLDYYLFSRLRASILIMAPCLARFGRTRIPMPGGCKIGARPIDLHLKGFAAMGAKIKQGHGFVEAAAKNGLKGAKIYLDFPSVGATENIMTAACLADGVTTVENAAGEPEIEDLAEFLNGMGAKIEGAGSDTLVITGVPRLHGGSHRIMSDRIEAGTFLTCAAGLGAQLRAENLEVGCLKPLLAKLTEMGLEFETGRDYIELKPCARPAAVDIKTLPYPGFPTDLQAQTMALLTTCDGNGMVVETLFENRFSHIPELCRMGAEIKTEGNAAFIEGVKRLTGAEVKATDLRAGAALVAAALKADGMSVIHDIEHIERGYENFPEKLRSLGGDITAVD